MSNSEIINTVLNCQKAIAAFAVMGALLTVVYIAKNQDIGLSIFKLLINGMALTYAISSITAVNTDTNDNTPLYVLDISYESLIMMILTLALFTLKRTQFNECDAIFGTILLVIIWLSGAGYLAVALSPAWNDSVNFNTILLILFLLRILVVIFVAIRLAYHRSVTTLNPPKASLFALNLARLLFIFIWLILDGPVLLDSDTYPVVFATIIIIVVLVLTSVKIEYPDIVGAARPPAVVPVGAYFSPANAGRGYISPNGYVTNAGRGYVTPVNAMGNAPPVNTVIPVNTVVPVNTVASVNTVVPANAVGHVSPPPANVPAEAV